MVICFRNFFNERLGPLAAVGIETNMNWLCSTSVHPFLIEERILIGMDAAEDIKFDLNVHSEDMLGRQDEL